MVRFAKRRRPDWTDTASLALVSRGASEPLAEDAGLRALVNDGDLLRLRARATLDCGRDARHQQQSADEAVRGTGARDATRARGFLDSLRERERESSS